jgi:hypothetical protein
MSILLSILLALSGMTVMALADQPDPDPPNNKFSGNVTLNGADAFIGVVIDAYIDGDHRGTITVESSGEYGDFDGLKYLDVTGNASDDGKTITFTVCGATTDQNATWYAYPEPAARVLDLTAVDDEAPEVTNTTATPASIVANGTDATQLTVNVTDGCRCTVGNVTVNLSAIGGDEAQKMTCIEGTDVYSVTVNATEGTLADTYYLQVNASDVFGNCNTSVCIGLTVEAAYVKGDFNRNGVIDIGDVAKIANLQLGNIPTTQDDLNIGDFNSNDVIDIGDVAKLANYQLGNIDEL